MSNWNWKCECCLAFCGLLVGGPLGTYFLKAMQRSVEPSGKTSYPFFLDNSGNPAVSLLVPSSLWFLVTTSCVGGFFWLLGEVLRKLHSATGSRSMDAASARASRERVARARLAAEGGGDERQGGERIQGMEGVGGGLGHDHNYQIHHPGGGYIFPFLPYGRLRLWGVSFL